LDKTAFFFQGDNLLLPIDCPDSKMGEGLPLDLSKDFDTPDIFQIPSIDNACPLPITAVSVPLQAVLSENWKAIPVRQTLSLFSTGVMGDPCRIIRACHIVQWRHSSRFCGTCGTENTDVPKEAQRLCPKCGRSEFPRICPAVIVAITDDEGRILLAHNRRFKAGTYSHISGFNEAGETLEETVVREVREEVNIEVKEIAYVKSQPWPFPNSLMVGFKARFSSGTIKPDGEEIEDAKWFSADNLPNLPAEGSLSRYLINCWLKGSL